MVLFLYTATGIQSRFDLVCVGSNHSDESRQHSEPVQIMFFWVSHFHAPFFTKIKATNIQMKKWKNTDLVYCQRGQLSGVKPRLLQQYRRSFSSGAELNPANLNTVEYKQVELTLYKCRTQSQSQFKLLLNSCELVSSAFTVCGKRTLTAESLDKPQHINYWASRARRPAERKFSHISVSYINSSNVLCKIKCF